MTQISDRQTYILSGIIHEGNYYIRCFVFNVEQNTHRMPSFRPLLDMIVQIFSVCFSRHNTQQQNTQLPLSMVALGNGSARVAPNRWTSRALLMVGEIISTARTRVREMASRMRSRASGTRSRAGRGKPTRMFKGFLNVEIKKEALHTFSFKFKENRNIQDRNVDNIFKLEVTRFGRMTIIPNPGVMVTVNDMQIGRRHQVKLYDVIKAQNGPQKGFRYTVTSIVESGKIKKPNARVKNVINRKLEVHEKKIQNLSERISRLYQTRVLTLEDDVRRTRDTVKTLQQAIEELENLSFTCLICRQVEFSGNKTFRCPCNEKCFAVCDGCVPKYKKCPQCSTRNPHFEGPESDSDSDDSDSDVDIEELMSHAHHVRAN